MKSTAVWKNQGFEPANAASPDEDEASAPARGNISTLKELTLQLLREVESAGEVNPLRLEDGLDFYEEVTRFEIDLIKRALLQTAGHQGRAARLLKLKVTTLNSKIKHYHISLAGFANGYPLVETNEVEHRQRA